MIVLRFRQPDPAIIARWRGPDGQMAAGAVVSPPLAPVATLIGPPGVAGPIGPQGPEGPPFDINAALIDGGTFN
jgi:hypothetical protein